MSHPILLDEMVSAAIADQLAANGQDALAVVADPTLVALPDEHILASATAAGRALVTANIKDFMPLDAQYRAARQIHGGLILVSTKTFVPDRTYTTAITSALIAPVHKPGQIGSGQVHFFARPNGLR